MKIILKGLLSGVSGAALSCSAFAANMAMKAPPPAPVPQYSWTGFYGGFHVGGGWPQDPNSTVTMQRFTGGFPGGTPHPIQVFNGTSEAFPFGGIQAGYNWQIQPQWVVGLEADISASQHTNGGAQLAEGPLTDNLTSVQGIDWFGTVRGRAGYLVFPSLLAYGTGGLVYGHTRNDFMQAITGPGPVGFFTIANGTRSTSASWTAGGGLEWMLDRKWSVKLEYDYLRFNDAVASTTIIHFNPGKGGNTGVFNVQSPNNSAHTIQIGLNYHFWN